MLIRSISAALRDLAHPPEGQNAALDVLRSAAVLMVVATHSKWIYLAEKYPANLFTRAPMVKAGWVGVDLFFVLSGYLIGRQLWRELRATGTIDLKRFMIRRGFRIWPYYYAALAFTLLIAGPGRRRPAEWWPDAVFLSNYLGGVVSGGWSLCIEEHFYLFAPALIILAAPRLRSAAAFRPILIGLLALLPLVRAAIWWRLTSRGLHPDVDALGNALYYPTHAHADGLIMGLLIANLENTGALRRGSGWLGTRWLIPIGFALCGLCYAVSPRMLNYTGISLAFGSIIAYCLPRQDIMPAPIRSRVFYVLSRLSFGMYLNHFWFMAPVIAFIRAHGPDPWAHPTVFSLLNFSAMALASAALATLTFCLIEHPFLQLRERILAHGRRPVAAPAASPALAEAAAGGGS